ncbi:MAG: PH domain-containing protein [Acidimicrobiales bacterium]
MAYPRKLLGPEEEIVEDLRPHWWYLVKPVLALVVAIAVGVALLAWNDVEVLDWVGGFVVLLALGFFVYKYLQWVSTNFTVTTDRVIYRSGVLSKSGIEIPLERVNTVFFNQSIFERMIRAGDLAIESAGETGRSEFSDIRHPTLVQAEIYKQMEDNENRKFDRINRPAATMSVPEQIEKLDELRQRGVLSQQEFDAKKADLLGRM